MSKEKNALKLALDAVEWMNGDTRQTPSKPFKEITQTIREALAEQPAQQSHCNDCGGFDPECPLAQPAQGCEFCSHPLYVGTKCKNCGREQPEKQQSAELGEPYGWKVYGVNSLFMGEFAETDAKAEAKWIGGNCIAFPLYTSPQPSQSRSDVKPLVNATTWRGLTDEERLEVAEIDGADEWFWKVCKAIEAKLREKNA